MTGTERSTHDIEPDETLIVHPARHVGMDVVGLEGALTLADREVVTSACTRDDLLHVLVDLSGVIFMDCAGWGALVAAESTLRHRGGSLKLTNAAGEPRRLIELIRRLEDGISASLSDERPTIGDRRPNAESTATRTRRQ